MNATDELITKGVTRRLNDGMSLAEAISDIAYCIGCEQRRAWAAWERSEFGNPAQEMMLDFLHKDHGPYVVASLLDSHPLTQEFDLDHGSLLAKFKSHTFVIDPTGGLMSVPGGDHSG